MAADPRHANAYCPTLMTQPIIDAAYRGSGMMRKIIDIPALGMVQGWRNWRAEADQIKALEAEERRLDLRGKIRMAETSRGLGGGALILGVARDISMPANIRAIQKQGLAFIHVVSHWHLTLGPIVEDHTDPRFGGPVHFMLTTGTRGQQRIDPSRVAMFGGALPFMVDAALAFTLAAAAGTIEPDALRNSLPVGWIAGRVRGRKRY